MKSKLPKLTFLLSFRFIIIFGSRFQFHNSLLPLLLLLPGISGIDDLIRCHQAWAEVQFHVKSTLRMRVGHRILVLHKDDLRQVAQFGNIADVITSPFPCFVVNFLGRQKFVKNGTTIK